MPRILSLDLARGFTVLMIAPVHAIMLYSQPQLHGSCLGRFLAFIAEGPGAQLFMLLMGIYFSFQRPGTTKTITRSIGLLSIGYGLNLLKFILPLSLGVVPEALLDDLQVGKGSRGVLQLLLLGDILHFAGLALVVLLFIRKSRYYHFIAGIVAGAICLLSPLCWDAKSDHPLSNYLFQLATGQPPKVFFPLFPWLVYPLTGLTIGFYLRKDSSATFKTIGQIGAILITAGCAWNYLFPAVNPVGFYRTAPAATIWHIGIVLCALFVWHYISECIRSNFLFRLLIYSSKNITIIYIIQWVMICWLLPVFGYQQLGLVLSLVVMTAITINTYLASYCFLIIRQRYERQNLRHPWYRNRPL